MLSAVQEPNARLYTQAEVDALLAEARARAADKLAVTRDDVSLAAGEMTAQEWRTCAAVLRWMQQRILSS